VNTFGEKDGSCGIQVILRGPSTPCKDQVIQKLIEIGGSISSTTKGAECVEISIEEGKIQAAVESLMANHENLVRRKVFTEEMGYEKIFREHHQLFLCRLDLSRHTGLLQYCDQMGKQMVICNVTPGAGIELCRNKSTHQDVKCIILEIYRLIKSLHRIGYSLAGNFNGQNFVIDKSKGYFSVRFAHLNHGSLNETNPSFEDQDIGRLKEMVYWEMFPDYLVPPHDISYWLSLLGKRELEGLLPLHMALMDDQDAVNRFMSLYDTFKELKTRNYDIYLEIVRSLKGYNDWQNVLLNGNQYVLRTINHINQGTNKTTNYPADVSGLLDLFRNCKNHEARSLLQDFIRVVGADYPNLMYDFQREMFVRGYKG